MQIHRVLGILMTLIDHEKVTAPFLAQKFEVSRRTIQRDLDQILMAGIPIITMQGFEGGISLEKGYALDKTLFTTEELQAVFAGVRSIDSISDGDQLTYLMDKLSLKESAVFNHYDKIRIDLSSHYKDTLTPKIALIKKAMAINQCLIFDYYAKDQHTHREIEPYLLVYKHTSWYVLGYCLNRQGFRYFKLNRITQMKLSESSFVPRKTEDKQVIFDDFYTNQVKLVALFNPCVKYRLIEEYGIESFIEKENGLYFECYFNSVEVLVEWILSFGIYARVLEPRDACRQLNRILKTMFQYYEKHDV